MKRPRILRQHRATGPAAPSLQTSTVGHMENTNADTYTVGHLFAGIDGFGLGLDAVGAYRTVFTAEWADFPHRILTERVSGDVEHFRDVRELTDPPAVDVLTGGFPCQDLSLAGKGAGIHGARSGLWSEYARIIEAARPRVVLIENVPALLRRGPSSRTTPGRWAKC